MRLPTARAPHCAGTGLRRQRGFTLIELMVTLAIFAVLLAAAAPAFSTWVRNARVRTLSQTLQDAIRQAQTESLRRNRQIVFILSNDPPGANPTVAANGKNWGAYTVPLLGFEGREYINGGSVADAQNGVTITGQAALCFNSAGRLSANSAPGITGATCTLPTSGTLVRYDVASSTAGNGDRPLRVTVSVGGQVRTCDPARAVSGTMADGC